MHNKFLYHGNSNAFKNFNIIQKFNIENQAVRKSNAKCVEEIIAVWKMANLGNYIMYNYQTHAKKRLMALQRLNCFSTSLHSLWKQLWLWWIRNLGWVLILSKLIKFKEKHVRIKVTHVHVSLLACIQEFSFFFPASSFFIAQKIQKKTFE